MQGMLHRQHWTMHAVGGPVVVCAALAAVVYLEAACTQPEASRGAVGCATAGAGGREPAGREGYERSVHGKRQVSPKKPSCAPGALHLSVPSIHVQAAVHALQSKEPLAPASAPLPPMPVLAPSRAPAGPCRAASCAGAAGCLPRPYAVLAAGLVMAIRSMGCALRMPLCSLSSSTAVPVV